MYLEWINIVIMHVFNLRYMNVPKPIVSYNYYIKSYM